MAEGATVPMPDGTLESAVVPTLDGWKQQQSGGLAEVRRKDIRRILASLAVHNPANPAEFLEDMLAHPQANPRAPSWSTGPNYEMALDTSSSAAGVHHWVGSFPDYFSSTASSPRRPSVVLDSRARKIREFHSGESRVQATLHRVLRQTALTSQDISRHAVGSGDSSDWLSGELVDERTLATQAPPAATGMAAVTQQPPAHFVFVLGGPGSGKSTVCDTLVTQTQLSNLPVGALLRKRVEEGGQYSESIRAAMGQGQLVPDDIIFSLINQEIAGRGGPFVMDGFPRSVAQVQAMLGLLSEGCTYQVVFLDLGEDLMRQRVLAREERGDDAAFTAMVEQFTDSIMPLMDFFESQGASVSVIDCGRSIADVVADALAAVSESSGGAQPVAAMVVGAGGVRATSPSKLRKDMCTPVSTLSAELCDSVIEDVLSSVASPAPTPVPATTPPSSPLAQAGVGADDICARIAALHAQHPQNIALSSFEAGYYRALSPDDQAAFLRCLNSGIENPDSSMGCYACQPEDYDRFKPFFSKALAKYHKVAEDAKHVNDWSLEGVEGLPEGGVLDISQLGLPALSMRVRVGRNLSAFPLPGAMTREQRCEMESFMLAAFEKLIAMPEYGGKYVSITPGHPNEISSEEYEALVSAHIMFKDMSADSYLQAAGIAAHWPHGRGVYISQDKGFIIWVGEEDHLRIMCMKKGTVLNEVFDRLKSALDVVNGIEGLEFAVSGDYGVVTSCPTNLGTGMRASLHIALPNLTADGTDKKAKVIAKPLGLSVRGLGGEHTPIGADGTVDISPSARFCIKESEIITALYKGIEQLKLAEDGALSEASHAGIGSITLG
jgi:adenylate kinase family enzyme/protein-arginine kinase